MYVKVIPDSPCVVDRTILLTDKLIDSIQTVGVIVTHITLRDTSRCRFIVRAAGDLVESFTRTIPLIRSRSAVIHSIAKPGFINTTGAIWACHRAVQIQMTVIRMAMEQHILFTKTSSHLHSEYDSDFHSVTTSCFYPVCTYLFGQEQLYSSDPSIQS